MGKQFWFLIALATIVTLGSPQTFAQAISPNQVISSTPLPDDQLPDHCEPNNDLAHACVLALNAVNGPYTFVPESDLDFYSVDLGSSARQALTITIRATDGLDLLATMTQAGSTTPLATLSSATNAPSPSPLLMTTLAADVAGWVIIQIENRAAGLARGQSYRIELRTQDVLIPTPQPGGTPPTLQVDALENNWSPDTASEVAIGVAYHLTFACPDPNPNACPGGDHDYLRVPVKAHTRYTLATYELAPGVDPVIDLFWQDLQHPVASNDDAFPGGFAALVQWIAPANGELIVRIAPRNGAKQAVLPSTNTTQSTAQTAPPGGYTFAIALTTAQLSSQMLQEIAAAANVQLPNSATSGSAESAGVAAQPMSLPILNDGYKGLAIVSNLAGTSVRDTPSPVGVLITQLKQGAQLDMLGSAAGLWVRVQPIGAVVPGWAYGPDLSQAPAITPTVLLAITPAPISPAGSGAGGLATPTLVPTIVPRSVDQLVVRLPRLPEPPAIPAIPRLALSVRVVLTRALPGPASSAPLAFPATPTPQPLRPIVGMRIQLINVFGDLLTEVVTPADGTVTIQHTIGPQTMVRLRVPALGITLSLDPKQTELTIAVPTAQ